MVEFSPLNTCLQGLSQKVNGRKTSDWVQTVCQIKSQAGAVLLPPKHVSMVEDRGSHHVQLALQQPASSFFLFFYFEFSQS
jgi:hypothetical protein